MPSVSNRLLILGLLLKSRTPPLSELLASLPEPHRSALLSLYNGEPQLGPDGALHAIDVRTSLGVQEGMWLYRLCRGIQPAATLEVGLGFGYSTLYLLAAIREDGAGRHTAIDPYQDRWNGIGRHHPDKVGMAHAFRLIEERSFAALVHLADRQETFDLIFIDGNHRFDDVIVDFTLATEVCSPNGCIVFDDLWMPSVYRAVAFLRANRKDFEEIRTAPSSLAAFRRVDRDRRRWFYDEEFLNLRYVTGAIRRRLVAATFRRP